LKSIFVDNLDLETTEEELRSLFESYGKVQHIDIIRIRERRVQRGFAFVMMTGGAEADQAIKSLNGRSLRNRTLVVEYARPRLERPAA
jgi:RNA recognition motif-containing protein